MARKAKKSLAVERDRRMDRGMDREGEPLSGDLKAEIARAVQRDEGLSGEASLEAFLESVSAKGIELYPAQEEAILELLEGSNVILKTPTGSGKSLVAAALHFHLTANRKRSYYTCPIKALVNEKFLSLCKEFGAENVGISTGDATVNAGAPILCCTAEVLMNLALREGSTLKAAAVIMDEFHYYSDAERGRAWQIPLLALPQSQFLLISATLGNTRFFEEELEKLNGRRTVAVEGSDRPVPLEFQYTEESLEENLEKLRDSDKLPAYLVHFTQRSAVETAQGIVSLRFLSKEGKAKVAEAIQDGSFNTPFGKELKKYLRHGIGVHHAGMLPKYRLLVEKLAQENLLRVICGTDTLGVGVNVPIRTVLFTGLAKFDGEKMGILAVRDFHQIAGRAGRKGFDDQGWVVGLAPPHVIENRKRERKAASSSKKKKQPAKQPEKGAVVWDSATWDKLQTSSPEPLRSRFFVDHGLLLNVLSRPEDGCRAMRELIRNCHDGEARRDQHFRRGWQLFRSLLDKGIVEIAKDPESSGRKVRVHLDLQEDFSLNHALSLYLVDTVRHLDREGLADPLLMVSLVEAVLENPHAVIRRQVDKQKDILSRQLKEEGIPYEERMERLQEVEHPKPEADFIYNTFNRFAGEHPWVGDAVIRPKSIAREMMERHMGFQEYVREYGLARAEGILLRHLSSTYKTITQNVPEDLWTEDWMDCILFLEEILRSTDSSILDEWEAIREAGVLGEKKSMVKGAPAVLPEIRSLRGLDPSADRPAFLRTSRNAIFHFLRFVRARDISGMVEQLAALEGKAAFEETAEGFADEGAGPEDSGQWSAAQLESIFSSYWEVRDGPLLDPDGRAANRTILEKDPIEGNWLIRQVLVDTEGFNDWECLFRLDLEATLKAESLRMEWVSLQAIG